MKQYQVTVNNITYDIIEYSDGSKIWYLNENLHREDGPAIEWADGYKEYWYNGKILII